MTNLLRVPALVALAALVWLAGAAGVATHTRIPLTAVVPGAVVTQRFGCTPLELEPFSLRCPTHHFHGGIDLAAPTGTTVFSAAAGTAELGYDSIGAGNFVAVFVDGHVRLVYCHLSAFLVRPGQRVDAGQPVGRVGATGLATGPHVHFEVDVDGVPVDPALWLGAGS